MDIQERLTAFAMLGATWVMWLLVLLSIVCLAIILERSYYLFVSRDDVARLKADLMAKLRGHDVDAARVRMRQSRSVEAQVALAGLDASADGAAAAEQRMDGQTSISRLAMERNLAFLGTVGNNAPFVGLAGTVIGIIRAFHELDASQGQVSAGLMAEVGEALVATLIGLLVALPAVAFFNYFQRVIKTRITRADALGKEVLAYLKSERRGKGEEAAEAAAE
ncbi:MAG: MotA/TolQ/ExbB proton channel family protein [Myxococcota bacterium]|nr:MotA/TolQ/ExbB proton channel family protein [Myxococcota bacterium]